MYVPDDLLLPLTLRVAACRILKLESSLQSYNRMLIVTVFVTAAQSLAPLEWTWDGTLMRHPMSTDAKSASA